MLNVPARAPSLRAWAVNARTGTAARLIWSRTWVGVPPQPLATQVRPGRTKPPLDQVEALRAEVFFALAAELMKVHPPHLTDFSALARTTRIGLRPGECFDPGQLDAKTLAALDTVPKAAQDHFAAGELPPADAFWSITMYDEHGFQAANPINRFVIGDRDRLAYNNDGSLDIYIQHTSPGAGKEANWLPAPAGSLGITMRLYAPRPEALDGRWNPPPVRRTR
jgi:hypothetical protein